MKATIAERLKRELDLRTLSRRVLVSAFEYFYKIVYIQYAQKVASISWFGRDIVPTKVMMVNNIPQFGQRQLPIGYEQYQKQEPHN